MSAAPRFKVYTKDGEYVAACKYAGDAAAVISGTLGEGATIRDGHTKKSIVWTEGVDGCAGESYDHVADIVETRVAARAEAFLAKFRSQQRAAS
jgi:hypothetical protein